MVDSKPFKLGMFHPNQTVAQPYILGASDDKLQPNNEVTTKEVMR